MPRISNVSSTSRGSRSAGAIKGSIRRKVATVLRKKGRKAPPESATLYRVGRKKIGRDGTLWIVRKNVNGVRLWRRLTLVIGAKRKPTSNSKSSVSKLNAAAMRRQVNRAEAVLEGHKISRKAPLISARFVAQGKRMKGLDGRWHVKRGKRWVPE